MVSLVSDFWGLLTGADTLWCEECCQTQDDDQTDAQALIHAVSEETIGEICQGTFDVSAPKLPSRTSPGTGIANGVQQMPTLFTYSEFGYSMPIPMGESFLLPTAVPGGGASFQGAAWQPDSFSFRSASSPPPAQGQELLADADAIQVQAQLTGRPPPPVLFYSNNGGLPGQSWSFSKNDVTGTEVPAPIVDAIQAVPSARVSNGSLMEGLRAGYGSIMSNAVYGIVPPGSRQEISPSGRFQPGQAQMIGSQPANGALGKVSPIVEDRIDVVSDSSESETWDPGVTAILVSPLADGTPANAVESESRRSLRRKTRRGTLASAAGDALVEMARTAMQRSSASERFSTARFSMFSAALAEVPDSASARHPERARGGAQLLGGLRGSDRDSFLGKHGVQEGETMPIPSDMNSLAVVKKLFFDSMPKEFVEIESVEQVINPRLLRRFLQGLSTEAGCIEATWHGTPEKFADNILKEGLLKDMNTTAAYGHGAYVGAHAGVAHQYADPSKSGRRCMCVVLVHIGRQLVKGEMGTEKDVTAADRVVNPTQYCFVDESRLLVSHLIKYSIATVAKKRIGGGWADPFSEKLNRAINKASVDRKPKGIL